MEAWKGHMLLLESLALLKHLKNWTACVVGGAQRIEEHRYLSDLKHAADKLGISNRVRFVGQSTNVLGFLAAADIHCQPNLGPEPYGITFIEALYAGLPLITTAIGGAREIVNDSCGILVPPGQPEQLGYALAQLIENRDLRRALGSAGPARARQLCDPKTQMPKIFDTLRSIPESVNYYSAFCPTS
jgi:glycosyltransferase involved in cell wall biosynthesis